MGALLSPAQDALGLNDFVPDIFVPLVVQEHAILRDLHLPALPRALEQAREAILGGEPVVAALDDARRKLTEAGFDPIDYVALVDAATLEPLDVPSGEMRLIAAAVIGTTRLIDNIRVVSATVRI